MASVDYFLKITDIPGESADAKHKAEIDIESWSWGETNSGSHAYGGGGGAGKVAMQDFLACANGTHIKETVLCCRKAGKDQQEYLKIKFSDSIVSNYQIGGSTADVVPVDKIALNFAKIEITYAPQKPDGTLDSPLVHNWSLKENKGA
jgi:type VI secretion system secreted protein Hcp